MKLATLLLPMLPLIQLGCAHPKQAAQTPVPTTASQVAIILHEFETAGYAIPQSIVDELVQKGAQGTTKGSCINNFRFKGGQYTKLHESFPFKGLRLNPPQGQ